ncbi:MAG: sensor histidine kinase [Limisphaerales bacterium]
MAGLSSDFEGETGAKEGGRVTVFTAALIGLLVTLAVGWLVNWEHRETVQTSVEKQSERAAARLHEAFSVNQETLLSIGSFFNSSREISRKEFGTFVARSFARDNALIAFTWVPLVTKEEREAYVAKAKADGLAGFEFKERGSGGLFTAREQELYSPIFFAEPMHEYHQALGLDLWSQPARRAAMEKARDGGVPMAAKPLRSTREEEAETRLIVYLPIYGNGVPEKVEDRRQQLRGFASAVFSLDRLVQVGVADLEPGIAVELFDLAASEETPVSGRGADDLTESELANALAEDLELAGREWSMRFTPRAAYYAAHPNTITWLAVCACLAFTTLVCAWLHSLAVRQGRIERIVNERTSDLVIANAALKQENKERKTAESSTREKSAELEELNKELESFSYSISHDLRAPLRAITGFTGFVLRKHEEHLPKDAVDHLHQVTKAGNQMNELIEGLLQFSRLQRAELKKRNCNMSEMARAILTELQTTMPERRVDVIWGKLPAANADPTLIRQVWQNLISNALKYTGKADAPMVEIGSKTSGREVIYYVRDNGAGFDMSQADRLFGVFQRFHAQTQFEGTGIGLANVHKVVQRHGGRIWAEAEVDKGATFFFLLGDNRVNPEGDSAMLGNTRVTPKK